MIILDLFDIELVKGSFGEKIALKSQLKSITFLSLTKILIKLNVQMIEVKNGI